MSGMDAKLLEALISHTRALKDVPPGLQQMLEQHLQEDAKSQSKRLHALVSQQQTARAQLRKIHADKVQFETSWEQYLQQLAQTLEAQTKERATAIQAFGEAEEAWRSQLDAASTELARLTQENQSAPSEFQIAVPMKDMTEAVASQMAQAEQCSAAAAEQCQQLQLALKLASATAADNLHELAQSAPGRESSRTPRRKRPSDQLVVSDSDEVEVDAVCAKATATQPPQ